MNMPTHNQLITQSGKFSLPQLHKELDLVPHTLQPHFYTQSAPSSHKTPCHPTGPLPHPSLNSIYYELRSLRQHRVLRRSHAKMSSQHFNTL